MIDPYGLEPAVLPGPVPLPIILPKTDAQIEADNQLAGQLADWVEHHYNPDWFQDTLDLLWNDPIDYWSDLLGNDGTSSDPCSLAAEHKKKGTTNPANKEKHQKGEKRKKQKYNDKKRQRPGWQPFNQ